MKNKVLLVFTLLIMLSVIPASAQDIDMGDIGRATGPTWLVDSGFNFAGIGTDFTRRNSPKGAIVYRMRTPEKYDAISQPEALALLLVQGKASRRYTLCYSTYFYKSGKTWMAEDDVTSFPDKQMKKYVYPHPGLYVEYFWKDEGLLNVTMFGRSDECP